jgi:hypothetical protein
MVMMTGCPVPFDDYVISSRTGNTSSEIAGSGLQSYVPAPTAGATPVWSFAADSFVGVVDWTEGGAVSGTAAGRAMNGSAMSGVFRAGTAYTAKVTLYPMTGYTFAGTTEFSHADADGALIPRFGTNGEVTLEIVFATTGADAPWNDTPEEVSANDVDLFPAIPRPADNAAPVRAFVTPEYMGTVAWTENGGGAFGVFRAGNSYTADVTLYAREGYAFKGTERISYDSVPVEPDPVYQDGTFTLTIQFSQSLDGGPWVVTPDDLGSVNLTAYIPAPVAGATPVRSFAAKGFVGIVVWKEGDPALFQVNTAYTADVTLYAAAGYTFTEETMIFYDSKPVSRTLREDGTITLTLGSFSRTGADLVLGTEPVKVASSLLDLAGYIPKPVTGGTPVRSFSASSFVGTVAWTGGDATGLFQAGTDYDAAVTLYAQAGYTFKGVTGFKYNGDSLTPDPNPPEGDRVTLAIDFDGTDPVVVTPPQPVGPNDLDLARYIPKPATGGTPVRSFAATNYVGVVTWKEGGNDVSGLFQAGKTYTAEAELYAAAGYTFTGAGKFTYSAGDLTVDPGIDAEGTTLTRTISFPATASLPTVTELDLTGKVSAPARDADPVTEFAAPQYTGTVAWKEGGAGHTGAFAGDKAYTATVTLTAAPGWTFAGIPAATAGGCFTHGGGAVSHDAGAADSTLIVTITFTKTDAAPVTLPSFPIKWDE